jgi:aryl-alcohol dehydrogenase-like predicted oxidoreductase
MELRHCGDSGLRLSALGMGCWAYGGGEYWGAQNQADVNAVVRAAVDLGITYFDTAEAYNDGRSESSLGEALAGLPRERVVIGTKVSPSNCHPATLVAHCDESLRRLRTDYIDLYMVHWPITPTGVRHFTSDPALIADPPGAAAAFEALGRLRQAGKIRHAGVSNFAVAKIEEARRAGVPLAANELPYGLLTRAIERAILPHCRRTGTGVIGYMPLLQGLLADLYPTLDDVPLWQQRTRHFDSRRPGSLARHGEAGAEAETQAVIAAVRRLAREAGTSSPDLALRWALSGPGIACVLAGSRNLAELQANADSAAQPLDPRLRAELDAVSRPLLDKLGPSFDYYENPADDRTV